MHWLKAIKEDSSGCCENEKSCSIQINNLFVEERAKWNTFFFLMKYEQKNELYLTTIDKQVPQLILISFVGTDVSARGSLM